MRWGAHPGVYPGCQGLRRKHFPGPLIAVTAMLRFDRGDAVIHADVEDDELVHTDVGQKDAYADAVVAEDQRHGTRRHSGEREVAVTADHRRNTRWGDADARCCHPSTLVDLTEVAAGDTASDDSAGG